MSTSPDLESAVRALADQNLPAEAPEVLAARRERVVGSLSRAIRQTVEERERRGWFRRGAASLALAASVALGVGAYAHWQPNPAPVAQASANIGLLRSVSGTLVVTHGGRARVVSQAEHLGLTSGDELRTAADGSADLQAGRSRVRVGSATQLTLMAPSSADERFRLASGRIDLHVAKQLRASRSVVVETPHADVVVRGTVFSVAVGAETGVSVTRVNVQEGSVWVLHDGERELLAAGEEWSSNRKMARSGGSPIAAPIQAPLTAPNAANVLDEKPVARVRGRAVVSAPATRQAGTLAEENALFQRAVDARNRGDDRRALDAFATLLARFPQSRLVEEARVERMRALKRVGDSGRAAVEARRYLADHASGFARDEARATALGEK